MNTDKLKEANELNEQIVFCEKQLKHYEKVVETLTDCRLIYVPIEDSLTGKKIFVHYAYYYEMVVKAKKHYTELKTELETKFNNL